MPQQSDARRLRRVFDLRLPDLLTALGVNSHCGVVGRDVDHTFVDQRLCLLAAVVIEAIIPQRNEAFDGIFVICVSVEKRCRS
jgi:hypothetical protein